MRRRTWSRATRNNVYGYLFLLPSLLGFLLFIALPVLMSLLLGFADWNFVSGLSGIKFVGFKHFVNMWKDEWFTASLLNNLFYTGVLVPCAVAIGLVFAVVLNDKVFGKQALRTIFFMPYISNIVAVSVVWMALFQSTRGPINNMLLSLGVDNPPGWLASPDWALPAITIIGIWINIGFNMVVFLAALQGIPRDLYEAAAIDGARGVRSFFHITLPMLSPTTFFLLVIGVINSFQVFAPINVITEGGPGTSTTVLVYYLYLTAFSYNEFGYASALAWVLFIIIFALTFVQWKWQKRWVNY